jgi:hypothetical protein
LIDIE